MTNPVQLLSLVTFTCHHYYFAMYSEQNLTIPAAFVVHERKFQSVHEEFMKFVSLLYPQARDLKEMLN